MSLEEFLEIKIKIWESEILGVWSFSYFFAIGFRKKKKVTQPHSWISRVYWKQPSLLLFDSVRASGRREVATHLYKYLLESRLWVEPVTYTFILTKGLLKVSLRWFEGLEWLCIAKTMTKDKAMQASPRSHFSWL
jgi:hypothetical protein